MSSPLRIGMRLSGAVPARRCFELASMAEAFGLSSIWFAENPMERSVAAALGACAMATTRIELGVGVWNPFMRHPSQIAMEVGALDELSGGRLSLGLGSGLAAPIARLGIDNRRTLAALRDSVAIVRGLLGGEAFTYNGKAFSVEDTKLSFRPVRPAVPILLAARGPNALALAREIADGLIVSNMCPPAFAAQAASIAKPGRLVQYVPCAVGPDRAKAMATMKPVLAGMLKSFWGLAQKVPAAHTSLVAHSGIPDADFAVAAASGEPDERFFEAFTVTGDADDCRRRAAAYRAAGVTDLAVTFVGPDPIHDMAWLLRAAGSQAEERR
jgi:5,10-methylenetetrahydromethanopterin reductase